MAVKKEFYEYDAVGNLQKKCIGYSDTSFGKVSSAERNRIRCSIDSKKLYRGKEFTTILRDSDMGIAGEQISSYVERFAEASKMCDKGIDPALASKKCGIDFSVDPILILAWIAGIEIEDVNYEAFMQR